MSTFIRFFFCVIFMIGPVALMQSCDVDVEGTPSNEESEEASANDSSDIGAITYTLYCDQGDATGCFVLDMEDPSSLEQTALETACETAGGSIENSCDGSVGICSGLEFLSYEVDYHYDAGVAFLWEAACNLLDGDWSE